MEHVRFFISAAIVLGMLFSPGGSAGSKNSAFTAISRLYRIARKHTPEQIYIAPTPGELTAFERLVTQCLEHFATPGRYPLEILDHAAHKIGMQLVRIPGSGNREFLVLMEPDGIRAGKGFYVLTQRMTSARPVIIQTPHARSDMFTGKIGLKLFTTGSAAAFFSSTLRRNARSVFTGPEQVKKFHIADPAHNPNCFFHAATKAATRFQPDTLTIQLHGFESGAPGTGRHYTMILSSGIDSDIRDDCFAELDNTIRKCLPEVRIGKYGVETGELGARANVQGRFINRFTPGCFLHVEMSYDYRNRLMQSKDVFTAFSHCFQQVIDNYETR